MHIRVCILSLKHRIRNCLLLHVLPVSNSTTAHACARIPRSPSMGRGCQKGDGAVAAALAHAPPRVKGKAPGGGDVAKGKDAKGKDAKGKDAKGKDAKGKDAKGKGDDGKGDDGKGDKGKGAAARASSFALDGYASTSSESDSPSRCICRCGATTAAADPRAHWQVRGGRMLQCKCTSCGPHNGRCTVRCWYGVCSECCM